MFHSQRVKNPSHDIYCTDQIAELSDATFVMSLGQSNVNLFLSSAYPRGHPRLGLKLPRDDKEERNTRVSMT